MTAYTIIETGNKQYRVAKGDIIEVEKLKAACGEKVRLDNVLLFSDGKNIEIGRPYLKNVSVIFEVLSFVKGKKTVSFKYKRRKSSRKKIGHRQQLTRIKAEKINVLKPH